MARGRKFLGLAVVFFAAFLLVFSLGQAPLTAEAQTAGSDLYWSERNAPVLYGATKITLAKNAVESFDIKDSRFRLFAKDFEDGDLESSLNCSGQEKVQPTVPGDYKLHYSVSDSHGNKSELDVTVKVTDDDDHMISVERTMYLIPNDWNMTSAGFSRCNGGDRQILGIYLPADSYFDMKILSSADALKAGSNITALTVAMLNDDARRETAMNISVSPSATDPSVQPDGYTRVTNEYKENNPSNGSVPGNYASVPLLSSNKLLRGVDINTTYKFVIRYDAEKVHRLNYYHYGDKGGGIEGENAFVAEWQASGDDHGVLENEAITVIVPKEDMPRLHEKNGNGSPAYGFVFESIDAHLAYYKKVVDRMDEIVGLKYNADRATDQNFRAKYLVKANAHGAGAAYYAGNHVGINSKVNDDTKTNGLRGQMYAFFQMNWGGLHELAHGYQGGLGGGSLGLGEVSNNILGYYIQEDKSIYTLPDSWLGNIRDREQEERRNQYRIREEDPRGFLDMGDFDDAGVGIKLYVLINLFESFEGADTYAKLFSDYREARANGENLNQQDFYTRFFLREYDVNIVPYFEQWGVGISPEIEEEASYASESVSILADSAGDSANEIIEQEGKDRLYGLVRDSELSKHGVTGNLTVSVEGGAPSEGKTILLMRGDSIVAQSKISGAKATFDGVPAGSYILRTPVIDGYKGTMPIAVVESGESSATVTYEKVAVDRNPVQIYIAGIRGTLGWSIDIRSADVGRVNLGAADLGNRSGSYWKDNPDETYIAVSIRTVSGALLYEHVVRGDNYFVLKNETYGDVKLGVGSVISIYTQKPQLVTVRSLVTNKVIDGFTPDVSDSASTLEYEITDSGLIPRFKEGFSADDALYDAIKDVCLENIEEMKEYFDAHEESLAAKYLDRASKDNFESWYRKLRPEDRQDYDALYDRITGGAAPVLGLKQDSVSVEFSKEITNWGDFLYATDAEDGVLSLDGDNVTATTSGDITKAGKYTVALSVRDSDGNASNIVILNLTVKKNEGMTSLAIALICVPIALVLGVTACIVAVAVINKRKSN